MSQEKESTKTSYSERLSDTWEEQMHPVHCSLTALSNLIIEAHGSDPVDSQIVLSIGYFLYICTQRINAAINTCMEMADEHYEIFRHFAELYGKTVEEYVLTAAKSAVSSPLEDEENGELEGHYRFLIHNRLGGTD